MKKKLRVLVFPGGTEIGLEIHKALSQCKDISLFSAGLDVSNHAPYVYAQHFLIPNIRSSNWIDRLNQIIGQHNIDYVYPAYDDVLTALTQHAEQINAR